MERKNCFFSAPPPIQNHITCTREAKWKQSVVSHSRPGEEYDFCEGCVKAGEGGFDFDFDLDIKVVGVFQCSVCVRVCVCFSSKRQEQFEKDGPHCL